MTQNFFSSFLPQNYFCALWSHFKMHCKFNQVSHHLSRKGGSSGHWHSCKEQSSSGTTTTVPPWQSSPQQKCPGWQTLKGEEDVKYNLIFNQMENKDFLAKCQSRGRSMKIHNFLFQWNSLIEIFSVHYQ